MPRPDRLDTVRDIGPVRRLMLGSALMLFLAHTATVSEDALARSAGAAQVFVATLARAQAERVERWDAGSSNFEAGGSRLEQIGRSAT